jgi:glycosyltransferase involved in cell wall biosynthesis
MLEDSTGNFSNALGINSGTDGPSFVKGGPTIRILYVCPKYFPRIGGSAVHVKNIAERLAKTHKVSVFVPNPIKNLPREEEINGVKIRRFKCLAPDDSYYLSPSLSIAARETRADILHIHGYYDLTPPLTILLKRKDQKCVFTLHSSGSSSRLRETLHLPFNVAMRKIMRRVDRVVCVSRFELEHFRKLLSLPKDKMEMIPNGVNPVEFRKDDCLRANPPILLSAGRLERYKGHHKVLRAFRAFRELFPEVGMQLYIVGKGPYRSKLEKESEKLGIRDFVRFFEWLPQQEYVVLLKASSVFILLSEYESQSIAVSEALFAGTATIVTDNSALAEYVKDRRALGVKNPDNSYEVAQKIKSVYSDSRLTSSGNDKMTTWDEVAEKTVAIYRDLLQSTPH